MERLILSGLSVLLISAMNTPSVKAEMVTASQTVNSSHITEVQPFNLVYLGYQGYFQEQGIPSNSAFLAAIKSGKVNPTELVKSAIERGRLTPEALNDQSYLSAVEFQLRESETH